jgi:hypothetical protein
MSYVLCVTLVDARGPDWDRLFEVAAGQSGYFTTTQAAEAGYSTHLLRKHTHAGRVTRAQRGIYRLVHFPAGEHEELVTAWLWSEQAGVISHQTALSLRSLSDVLPAQVPRQAPAARSATAPKVGCPQSCCGKPRSRPFVEDRHRKRTSLSCCRRDVRRSRRKLDPSLSASSCLQVVAFARVTATLQRRAASGFSSAIAIHDPR